MDAGLIIICWMVFLAMLMSGLVMVLSAHGPRGHRLRHRLPLQDLRSLVLSLAAAGRTAGPLFEAAGSVLFLWVYFATAVKRLHDRDKTAWWAIPLVAIPIFYNQVGGWLPDDSYFVLVISVLAFVFCIWGFVELYCLKGSRKTNRFGANPLAPTDTRPRWEQQSEVEMVPHKAGPPPGWRVKSGYE